jgi:hypothetical protein
MDGWMDGRAVLTADQSADTLLPLRSVNAQAAANLARTLQQQVSEER